MRVYSRAEYAGRQDGFEFSGFRELPKDTRQLHDPEKPAQEIQESSGRPVDQLGSCY